jgi:hypothetical protein
MVVMVVETTLPTKMSEKKVFSRPSTTIEFSNDVRVVIRVVYEVVWVWRESLRSCKFVDVFRISTSKMTRGKADRRGVPRVSQQCTVRRNGYDKTSSFKVGFANHSTSNQRASSKNSEHQSPEEVISPSNATVELLQVPTLIERDT